MKNKVGHTSSTILNSCSFQRYRPLFVKASSNFLTHPLIKKMKALKSLQPKPNDVIYSNPKFEGNEPIEQNEC